MEKLSEKKYWDSIYNNLRVEKNDTSTWSRLKSYLKFKTRDYTNSLIWEYILPSYIVSGNQKKVIEIGCAPGKYLIDFKNKFLLEPYGVEYSEKGVEITKINFSKSGIDPQNVIHADFFDPTFHEQNDSKYDVVFSRGFIEHFDDPKRVVGLHADLLKGGGLLVIMIPNLNGINRVLGKILNMDSYILHNVSIMAKDSFSKLFDQNKVESLFCGPVGFFSWGLFNTNSKLKYIFYRTMLLIQRPFDWAWRAVFGFKYANSWFTSPYLLYIGRKK